MPDAPFTTSRRYLPGTNVLETTFATSGGSVRIVDAMTIPNGELSPMRELARSIEGLREPFRCDGGSCRGLNTDAVDRAASGGTECGRRPRWRSDRDPELERGVTGVARRRG